MAVKNTAEDATISSADAADVDAGEKGVTVIELSLRLALSVALPFTAVLSCAASALDDTLDDGRSAKLMTTYRVPDDDDGV